MKTNSDTTPALYIGLDVHKEKTSVAIADPGTNGEVRSHGEVATTQVALERLIRRIAKARKVPVSRISVCYEAGGCGMWIARLFTRMQVPCTVVAPSLIPTKAGDHVKTDKRTPSNSPASCAPVSWFPFSCPMRLTKPFATCAERGSMPSTTAVAPKPVYWEC